MPWGAGGPARAARPRVPPLEPREPRPGRHLRLPRAARAWRRRCARRRAGAQRAGFLRPPAQRRGRRRGRRASSTSCAASASRERPPLPRGRSPPEAHHRSPLEGPAPCSPSRRQLHRKSSPRRLAVTRPAWPCALRRAQVADGSVEYGMGFDEPREGDMPLQLRGVDVLIAPPQPADVAGRRARFRRARARQLQFHLHAGRRRGRAAGQGLRQRWLQRLLGVSPGTRGRP